jgi:hypothetical protein
VNPSGSEKKNPLMLLQPRFILDRTFAPTNACYTVKPVVNKRNPQTDLPPFLTQQKHERFTLLRVASV